MSFNLQQLTEGIRQRHVGTQNKRLVEKWNRTGLLRGLDDVSRENIMLHDSTMERSYMIG